MLHYLSDVMTNTQFSFRNDVCCYKKEKVEILQLMCHLKYIFVPRYFHSYYDRLAGRIKFNNIYVTLSQP